MEILAFFVGVFALPLIYVFTKVVYLPMVDRYTQWRWSMLRSEPVSQISLTEYVTGRLHVSAALFTVVAGTVICVMTWVEFSNSDSATLMQVFVGASFFIFGAFTRSFLKDADKSFVRASAGADDARNLSRV
jgi:hypothetical protein